MSENLEEYYYGPDTWTRWRRRNGGLIEFGLLLLASYLSCCWHWWSLPVYLACQGGLLYLLSIWPEPAETVAPVPVPDASGVPAPSVRRRLLRDRL